jgi:formylglycine-generating enzyme required for sulfatase activity
MKITLFLSVFLLSFFYSNFLEKPTDPIIRQLYNKKESKLLKARLILDLAEFDKTQFSPYSKETLIKTLLGWYKTDQDPYVHSAIDYLLRYGYYGKESRKLYWGQNENLEKIDHELAGKKPGKKDWYITIQGQTMVIIHGPVSFQMGSPFTEQGRNSDEILHTVKINRTFAIASKELTVAQFQVFLKAHPEVRQRNLELAKLKDYAKGSKVMNLYSPDDNGPQILANWYELAQYCNWLSEQDNIPKSQWCYPTYDEIKSGMVLPSNYLHRTGYRFPTEAEWEFACRAGTKTARFFGTDTLLLKNYAWYSTTTNNERTWPVGQLKPNQYGLFDVYGNVWEWCQDRRVDYRKGITVDKEDSILIVTDSVARTRRGGSFIYDASNSRSANRGVKTYFPNQRRDNCGLRVARTIL